MKDKKIFLEPLENFCELEYLTLLNCPMYMSEKHGKVIDLTAKQMDILAAEQIIKNMVPLRGIEISIIRRALGMSCEVFARHLKLSAATVFKWEKAQRSFISLPNDISVRLLVADEMKCDISKKFSNLSHVVTPDEPIQFKMDAA